MQEYITKKELLEEMGISYGQLYRWKRMGMIPESWFIKRPSSTGQETILPRKKIVKRIQQILQMIAERIQSAQRIHSLLKKSVVLIGLFGLTMVVLGEVLAAPLSRLFVGYDPDLMALTTSGFRIFALSFLFMGYAIFGSGFFTALNDGLTSALISFLRTLVFQIAAVLILPRLLGIDGIWYSILVAEGMAMILTAFFLLLKRRKYGYL